ncbi:MAG: hypothetical protein JWP87_3618 [Labilithrix sp.]|nr:hypothetical protein [Labilithrix sp.]
MNSPSTFERERRLWLGVVGRGIAGAVMGLVLMANPWSSRGVIAAVLVAYLLVDGGSSLYAAMRAKHAGMSSSTLLLVGVIDLAAAAVVLAVPALRALRVVGGVRAMASGACDVRWPLRNGRNELLAMAGVAAVGLGGLILAWPGPATVALPWLLGLEAMVSGALNVAGGASELKRAAGATALAGAA